MTDRAPCIVIAPAVPLCYRCRGPRGDPLVMPGEEGGREHLFHSDGSINEDDRHHCEARGWRAPIGAADEAQKSPAPLMPMRSVRPSVASNVTSGRRTVLLAAYWSGV